jgi:RND superfamily putative drug exporter
VTVTTPLPAAPNRRPWTVRVAAWSAAHRWPVFGLWFVLTIGTFAASVAAGGTKAVEAVSNDQRAKYEAGEALVVWNEANPPTTVKEPASQQFLMVVSSAGRTVDDPAFAADVAAITKRLTDLRATVEGITGPVIEQLIDPIGVPDPKAAALISPDRTTVRLVGRVPGDGQVVAQRLDGVPDELDAIRAAYPNDQIHVLNNTLTNSEISELINGGLDASLRLTIPLTFGILLVAFGAVVASVIPLLLAITALLAAFGILGIYSQTVSAVSPYASQLIVLIGLAVAVDYSLFMVTRFRTERRHGRAKLAAIDVASNTAGRAVFFSGLAVMISIGGLFLLDDPLFRSMAVGTISVIFVAVVGSLTFLPATLAILGDNVSRLRLPIIGRDREEGSGLWATIVRGVMRQPLIGAVAVVAGLVLLASPVVRLHMGQADFTSFPDSLDGVQAVNVLNEKWPTGSGLDLSVVVTGADQPATKTAVETMSTRILAIDGIGGPPKLLTSPDGKVVFVTYDMGGSENDQRNQDIVREVRRTIVPETVGATAGSRGLVTGDAAFTLDVVDFYARGMPMVALFVLSLSFGLLLIAFRSIVIPIKAILLNLLSTAAAYGVLVYVFQDGHFSDLLGFKPGPIESFIPVFIFTILFGLSMDYHVFILTRIKEARDHGMSSNEAVARGISITSGTVTSAAAIMVVVFGVFVTLELTIIKQLGLGLAVAVFLDATVVRSVLLPATMRLLGEWNWWLPRWLGWLPQVTIEGHVEDAVRDPA